jgi:hypothetical protein
MRSFYARIFLLTGITAIGLITASGCRKKKDTIVKIYVRDADTELPVAGCNVILKGVPTITPPPGEVILFDTVLTNASGEAIFSFNDVYEMGQAGLAVLNIEAFSDSTSGEGIIEVQQETLSEETVFMQ